MNLSKQHQRNHRGVTLVELLVVISILSVMTAIMIPRLRVINKDRNIREAARVVGSTLVKASNRAINEGVAGLIIERHDNFVDANNVHYAGTRMYIMRRLPPFAGDDPESVAKVGAVGELGKTMQIFIPIPLEHTEANPLIRIDDLVRLNHNSVRYRVQNVRRVGNNLLLVLALGIEGDSIRPVLQKDALVPYVVYRQPRKLESSRVELPNGYFIDLRLSGPLVPTPSSPPMPPDWIRGSVLDANLDPRPEVDDIRLFFNSHGAVERFTATAGVPSSPIPRGPFYFYVTNYDPDLSTDAIQSLQNPAGMWVTIDNATGSTNVAYNAPPLPTLPIYNQIQFARNIGKTKQSANQ